MREKNFFCERKNAYENIFSFPKCLSSATDENYDEWYCSDKNHIQIFKFYGFCAWRCVFLCLFDSDFLFRKTKMFYWVEEMWCLFILVLWMGIWWMTHSEWDILMWNFHLNFSRLKELISARRPFQNFYGFSFVKQGRVTKSLLQSPMRYVIFEWP